jgi:16S rRNA (uracil1498-N3)-methyltransferase
MRRRFFVDRFENSSATVGGDAAEHLGRVLRAEPGQLYELSDGHTVWLSRIEEIGLWKRGENRIRFALVEQIEAHEAALQLQLLIAIVKFDRFEWCLEKATELGIAEILPLAAERSDKALLDAAAKRHARWGKILVESAQQSRRLRPPKLHAAIKPAAAFVQQQQGLRIVLSERRDAPSLGQWLQNAAGSDAASLAIGPEGGWTDSELSAARAAGFLEASLGELILRTETAVISSLAIVRYALETK